MSKVKIKKVKVKIGDNDSNIADMFNQMLGTGSVNISIAYPRYRRIRGLCEQIVRLFEQVAESPFMRTYTEFAPQRDQIAQFCADARESIGRLFCADLSDYEWNLTLVEEETKRQFKEVYDCARKSNLVNLFIIMCDRLVPYRKNFAELSKLHYKFIQSMPGAEWCPFPFTTLNLKYIFSLNTISETTIKFFMSVLNRAYVLSRNLYDELQSPDIDIDQFVDFIMQNIDKLQQQPELSRCREAFAKIKESVLLLKENFNGYYRDFVSTKDNTIIMQHFIIDVSKSTEASPRMTQQFRTIMNYYRKMAQNNINNPQAQALFEEVEKSFSEIERGTENLHIQRSDEEDSAELDPADCVDASAVANSKK